MASYLKTALRQLAKSPGYTFLAVGALALGIGANTVLFSAINTLFLRPVPLPEPQRLARIYTVYADKSLGQVPMSWPRFRAYRDQQGCFSSMAAMSFTGFTLTGRGDPEQVQARRATQQFLAVLGVQPLLGRGFTADEDAPGGRDVVLLSHAYWKNRFGAEAGIVGQTIALDGKPFTVVGVLPALPFPYDQVQLFAPRPFETEGIPADLRERGTGYLEVIARLKTGISTANAEDQLRVIGAHYQAENPARVDSKTDLRVLPLQEDLVGQQRPMFLTLLAAVGCVLLIACANVANLLLARFTARRKEIAIRAALGATRRRIIAQFMTESVLTALLAGGVGILLAVWGVDTLASVGHDFIPRASELRLDWRVLLAAIGLSLLTGFLLGIVPAWQASRTDAAETLKDASRGSTGGRHTGRFRAALLVAEVAMSLVLLVAAALLVDSFWRLQKVDPGFKSENVTVFFLGLPGTQYPTIDRQAQFFEQALERIKSLPGVTHVAAVAGMPIANNGSARSPAAADGKDLPPLHERKAARRGTATPGFFAALGIPIVEGRDFTWRDNSRAPNVVIINERLAKRLFPHESPVGRRLITGIQSIPREVVGVYASVRSDGLAEPAPEEMYYPSMQIDGAFQAVLVRSERPAGSLQKELATAIHSIDPSLPIGDVQSYDKILSGAIADRRLGMALLGGFALVALILAGLGIYSVIAYGVSQRTTEFGIRMALGAEPGGLVKMVVREGLRLVLVGLLVGLLFSFGLTRLMQQQLFEVSATDPTVLGGVAVFLVLVAAFACLIPARSATKVDPIIALRAE